MNDVLTRAACDFENDTRHRQDISKDIENEIAIADCRGCVLAVIDHLPRIFNFALPSLTPHAFVGEVSPDSVRGVYGAALLSQPRDLSGRDDNALADRLDLPCNEKSSARFAALSRGAHLATGTVKWFNATKGFGFIQPDAVGADVFVHISAVERADMRDLNEGQKIAYEVVADRRTGKSSADNLQPA